MSDLTPCACGCGEFVHHKEWHTKSKLYKPGHFSKTPEFKKRLSDCAKTRTPKTNTHWRTCRYRARVSVDATCCKLAHIGGCKGKIQVAHVDGNFTNNDPRNLMPLCISHHKLLDLGRIDINNPVMPLFRTGSDGKRRYIQYDEVKP